MIKRRLVIFLMLIALAATVTTPVQLAAQSKTETKRKKKKTDSNSEDGTQSLSKKESRKLRKESKRKEKQERKKQKRVARENRRRKAEKQGEQEGTTATAKPESEYPQTQMKHRYRIDILASLYLDDLVKGNAVAYKNRIPDKAEQGIAFYEGVQLAADSLKKAGFKIDIYIHDVTTAKESVGMLIAEGKLDSSDLIIGDIPANDIAVMAAFARKMQVNFVSASPLMEGAISGNPYFSLLQPTLKAHCEWIAGNIALRYPNTKATLLYSNNDAVDEDAYRYLTANKNAKFKQLSVKTMPSKDILSVLLDTTQANVMVVPLLDAVYADSLLSTLSRYFPNTHFDIYGMPTWTAMNHLRAEKAWPNIAVHITSPFYLNATSASAKFVARMYKKDYGGKAPEAVYRGYEAMFWYAHLMKNYGTIFNLRYDDNTAAPFTSFDIRARTDKKGNIQFYENKHVFVTRYENGAAKTEQ